MKTGIENDTKIKCDFEKHFFMFFVGFGSILAPQIDPKLEKNCVKKLDAGGKPSTWFPPGMTRRAPKETEEKQNEKKQKSLKNI